MYLWRRRASQKWSDENEDQLRTIVGDRLAIIERPNHKWLQIEVASHQRAELQILATQFGGRIETLPRNWLKRALGRKPKPIKLGNRKLLIPAGAAFGTGEHATTAMCLTMLERVMRFWKAPALPPAGDRALGITNFSKKNFSARRGRAPEVVDFGTGSGILALAAALLGAKRVIAIDNDPVAISTAKQNARLNGIRGVQFRVADVLGQNLPTEPAVATANLFSELLVELIPKLRRARWLILSGILRSQERDVRRALARNQIHIVEVRRRGKWVAMLAGRK